MVFGRVAALCAAAVSMVAGAVAGTPDLYGRADGLDRPALSPSGDLVAVECAPNGAPSVCVFDIRSGGDPVFIPLGSEYRLQGIYWSSDDYVLINVSHFRSIQAVDGQQEYDFQRVIAFDMKAKEASLLMRDEGHLLDTQGVVSVLPDDRNSVLIEAWDRRLGGGKGGLGSIMPEDSDSAWVLSTFKANLKTGKSRRQDAFSPAAVSAFYDLDGKAVAELIKGGRADTMQLRRGNKVLLEYGTEGVQEFFFYGLDQSTGKLVVFKDVGDQDGLYYLSLEDGTMEPVTIDDFEVGRANSIMDSYTRGVVGFSYFDGFERQVFIDETLKAIHAQLANALPGQRVNLVSWSADKNKIAVSAETPGRPADFYVLDRNSGQLGSLGSLASHLVNEATGHVSAHSVTARDGLEMEVMLTLPPGKTMEDGPFPTLIMPHGGPEVRDGLGFDWWAQAYAAEGYMVLQPNFRGSSGYGQAFRNAGFGEFGGKMISDIADAGDWAIREGLVAEGAYCVVGASYGGYAALMMALDHAERTRCVISANGVSEPFALIGRYGSGSEGADYWERYLGANRYSDDTVRSRIAPRARTSEFNQPVMLLYAQEDTVVPPDQTTSLAGALKDRPGFELVSLGAEDHFMRTSTVRNKALAETLAFLEKNHPARQAPGG